MRQAQSSREKSLIRVAIHPLPIQKQVQPQMLRFAQHDRIGFEKDAAENRSCGEGLIGAEIALAGEKPGYGDVLVQCIPVQPPAAQTHLLPFVRRGPQQAGEPRQRDAKGPPVAQFQPH